MRTTVITRGRQPARHIVCRAALAALAPLLLLACAAAAGAPREIHSNGRGGGFWREPDTWHGAVTPSANDNIVIAAGDTVTFDGGADNGIAGRMLTVDPRGVLEFDESGAQLLDLEGPVVCYGTIRMDATRLRTGRFMLRLSGANEEQRRIWLRQRAGLLVYGRPGLGGENRNAVLSAAGPAAPLRVIAGTPERAVAGEAMMLDIHNAQLDNVAVEAARIDNTGAFADQRVNLLNNVWTGVSRIVLRDCDTPFVHYNRMLGVPDGKPLPEAAITLDECRLADVRGNRIAGPRAAGIDIRNDIDSALTDNAVSNCSVGVGWHGRNAMIKNLRVEQADTGVRIDRATGALEAVAIHGARVAAVVLARSEMQLTDLRIVDLVPDAAGLLLDAATATLLNANIEPGQIKINNPPRGEDTIVQRMEYLVVAVRGRRVPPRAMVEVSTAEVSGRPPPGRADLNVRNSPARLIDGMTPRPFSLQPLVLRSWSIQRDGARRDAPFYDLRVLVPSAEPDKPPAVLHEKVIEPSESWYRPEPNDIKPTIEIRIR